MSTSVTKQTQLKKAAVHYLTATLFCIVFAAIYEYFSHGVYSWYMMGMFLFPLLGGTLFCLPAWLIPDLHFPAAASRKLYGAGITTLTLGSCMTGVFVIYGSTNSLLLYYWIAGAVLLLLSLLCYILEQRSAGRSGQPE